jgi:TatD DNase family protein
MLNYTDTHCHLNYHSFEEDLLDVVQRAENTGVTKIMLPGIDLTACEQAVKIANEYYSCYAAIGIHPNDANTWEDTTLMQLRTLAQDNPKVLAIGEIGLDFYRDWATPAQQQEVLHKQLELARELSLPIIVHIRESIKESFDWLFQWQEQLASEKHPLATNPGVLHAFPGDGTAAKQAIDHHFKIGVGGPVTFKNATERRAMVKAIPLDSILLETDAPFMAPHPFRGKRNEPAYIPLIAEKIAEVLEVPLQQVIEVTAANAHQVFQW